jgi:hypothetical protein
MGQWEPLFTGDVNTQFTTQISVGDQITIGTQTKTVTAIASDSSLTVDSNWTTGGTGQAYTIVPACTVSIGAAAGGIGSGISMPGSWSAGAMAKLTLGDYNQAVMALWGTGMVFRTYPGNAFVWQDNTAIAAGGPKEYMRLNTGTGNLGIGLTAGTSAGQKLEVNGNIKADGGLIISSPSAPSNTVTGMLWYNSSNNILYIRNVANNNWNQLFANK